MSDYIVHKAIEYSAISRNSLKLLSANTDWIISPKYDGCHAVFLFDNGKHYSTLSRTGETVRSMEHIAIDLLRRYPWLATAGRVAICGEAWTPYKDFNEISGLFRKHSNSPELMFVPFDYVSWDFRTDTFSGPNVDLWSDKPYSDRLEILAKFDWPLICAIVKPLFHKVAESLDDAWLRANSIAHHYKQSMIGCYDGSVLANANGTYVGSNLGKGGEFIKVKPLISYTVTVTGAELAKGNKTGKNTAALLFNLDGKQQRVSTGLTQEQVDEIAAVGWVGRLIEVEAMGRTVNNYLREPRFKGIRTDA